MTRVQLSDAEWEFIEPYLPVGEYGPYPGRLRQQFEGVIRRFKTGGQWREMPREFGAWSTVKGGPLPGQHRLHHYARPPRRRRDALGRRPPDCSGEGRRSRLNAHPGTGLQPAVIPGADTP
ncbi:transposase [Streptacidiphilus sp. MAP12-16]|uniref:transposase n=1 Tax=Streptacidiphilus sp. MAP12-16 TaxID=3156300 RepID=UPI003516C49D